MSLWVGPRYLIFLLKTAIRLLGEEDSLHLHHEPVPGAMLNKHYTQPIITCCEAWRKPRHEQVKPLYPHGW